MLGEIAAALADGPDGAPFVALLDAWGEWARGGCPMGYPRGRVERPMPAISDQAALEVDRAVRPFREDATAWFIWAGYYLRGLDVTDIACEMSRLAPFRDRLWRYATTMMVARRLTALRAQAHAALGGRA